MPHESTGTGSPESQQIDIDSEQDLHEWSRKLDVSPDQLKEAVQAVGPRATDVEDHLKGSRATTNSERVHEALKSGNERTGD
jgi:Protein of unknown function (DUF3606)